MRFFLILGVEHRAISLQDLILYIINTSAVYTASSTLFVHFSLRAVSVLQVLASCVFSCLRVWIGFR